MSAPVILPVSHEEIVKAADFASQHASDFGYNEGDYNDGFKAGAEWVLAKLQEKKA